MARGMICLHWLVQLVEVIKSLSCDTAVGCRIAQITDTFSVREERVAPVSVTSFAHKHFMCRVRLYAHLSLRSHYSVTTLWYVSITQLSKILCGASRASIWAYDRAGNWVRGERILSLISKRVQGEWHDLQKSSSQLWPCAAAFQYIVPIFFIILTREVMTLVY